MKKAEDVLSEISDNLQEIMDEHEGDINVFTSPSRMPILNSFALMFSNSLLMSIDDYNLTRNDIRVILKLCELMQFGNQLRISFAEVGKSLHIDKSMISKHIKKLKEAKIIIENDYGSLYLNPHIIAKGKFLQKGRDDELIKVLELGAKAIMGTNVRPSIMLTKKVDRQYPNLLSMIDKDMAKDKDKE